MPATRTRIITLTTDFGLTDHFTASMKGVILGIAPQAVLVDVTHQVTPFDVLEAAFTIAAAAPYFPKGTLHVVVVDPGVGTARRAILVEAGGQFFVGPDNGVFSMIYDRGPHKVRALTNTKLFLRTPSRTFHGRDIFAPVAAHLAAGTPPSKAGARIEDYTQLGLMKPNRLARRAWGGVVLKVDHFGNLITNLPVAEFPELAEGNFELSVGLRCIAGLSRTFAECVPGEPNAIIGSSGYLEVVVREGSAAKLMGCGSGAPVEILFGRAT
jgi:S-adenosyl-L-methionine hydrolase (adenosine-forming)